MGMKDHLLGKHVESDTSLAASFNTAAFRVISMNNVGFIAVTTGVTANTGAIVPQVRIKKSETEYSAWVNLTLDTPVVLADADISYFINLNPLPPVEIRLAYTKGSGTQDGTVDIWMSGVEN